MERWKDGIVGIEGVEGIVKISIFAPRVNNSA